MFRTNIILISFVLSSSVLATTVSQISPSNPFVIGLSAGPAWVTGNQTQAINLQPDVVKTYTASNQSSTVASVELFGGWQKAFSSMHQPLLGQLGISIVGAGNAQLSGDIWEDSDPAFDNFNYTYKVNHTHIAIKGRLVGNYNLVFEPYVSASAGLGFNHAYNFTINPKISEEVAAPGFQSNTTTTFTYSLGIGLQASFTPHLQAAIGYEFADWGQVQLASAPGQTINQGLTLNHLYGHELQLSLFYTV